MQAKQAQISIIYNSRDVSRDVSAFIMSLSYSGVTSEKADTIEVVFEDSAALWQNTWYPAKGDRLSVEIGYADIMVNVGTFVVDEMSITGPPDQITVRGISAGFSKAMRTKTSVAHEQKTLSQIVNFIASKNNLSVSGSIPDIFIERATQYRETDLCFLRRIASLYGCLFSVRDDKLIFTIADDIESLYSGAEIDRTDLINYSLTDKTSETYTSVSVKYHNHKNDKIVEGVAESGEGVVPAAPNALWQDPAALAMYTSADQLAIRCRVENKGQAVAIAKAALRKNYETLTGTITAEGNPLLMEGSNFDLTGMGAMSGRYNIVRCDHNIDASGYVMTLDIKRISGIDKSRWLPKVIINTNFSSSK